MEAEYRRDTTHTYMIIREETGNTGGYEARILEENNIQGLLPVLVESVNSRRYYRYDISNLRPFTGYCRITNPGQREIRKLLGSILSSVMRFEDYLLCADHLLLDPEYLFVTGEGEVRMAYVPFHTEDIRRQLQSLLEYLMMQVDHSDQDAVVFICRIMHELKSVNVELDVLLGAIMNDGKMPESAEDAAYGDPMKPAAEDIPAGNAGNAFCRENDAYQDTTQSEPRDGTGNSLREKALRAAPEPMTFVIAAAGLGAAALMYIALHFSGYAALGRETTAGVSLAAGAAAGLVVCMARKIMSAGKREEDDGWQYPENMQKGCAVSGRESASQGSGRKHYARRKLFSRRNAPEEKPFPAEYDAADNIFLRSTENVSDAAEETVFLGAYGNPYPVSGEGTGACLAPENASEDLPVIQLKSDDILIGKQAESVDFVLPHSAVSRVHARILKKDGKYFISDLGSRNGTQVDGELIAGGLEKELKDGANVKIADCSYFFRKQA